MPAPEQENIPTPYQSGLSNYKDNPYSINFILKKKNIITTPPSASGWPTTAGVHRLRLVLVDNQLDLADGGGAGLEASRPSQQWPELARWPPYLIAAISDWRPTRPGQQ